jgi:hypothetical protein
MNEQNDLEIDWPYFCEMFLYHSFCPYEWWMLNELFNVSSMIQAYIFLNMSLQDQKFFLMVSYNV